MTSIVGVIVAENIRRCDQTLSAEARRRDWPQPREAAAIAFRDASSSAMDPGEAKSRSRPTSRVSSRLPRLHLLFGRPDCGCGHYAVCAFAILAGSGRLPAARGGDRGDGAVIGAAYVVEP